MEKIKVFESHAAEYDEWFDKYPFVFKSEVEALRDALPYGDLKGIEIGLGTGRFAIELGIKEGIEPSESMRNISADRGIEVLDAKADQLPYKDLRFDFVLMASCINYFNELYPAFKEANRVLKPGGTLIVGSIDKKSPIGKYYESIRQDSIFYKDALFYTAEKVAEEIKRAGFTNIEFSQTLFGNLNEIDQYQPSITGHDKGSFIVIKAIKK